MFINTTNIPAMEVMAALAEGFFEAKCPKYSDNNYEKYVVVNADTHKCSFQRRDYFVKFGEAFFDCVKKDDHIAVSVLSYLLNERKPKCQVTNYDGEHIVQIDGNSKFADSGLTGEYVSHGFDMDWNKAIRGRITNVNELIDAGLYNEITVIDAYQAIGDFSKVINDLQYGYYPVYLHIPFCEDCSYLFQYQCFSSTTSSDGDKTCINYKFLGIISDGVTKDDIEAGKYFRKSIYASIEYNPFLLPNEVRYLTDALETAEVEFDHIFNSDDYDKYTIDRSFIMNRFFPKMVVETKYGIFYLVYDRASDLANLHYSNREGAPMERIPGYGGFSVACKIIKEKLEELSKQESVDAVICLAADK